MSDNSKTIRVSESDYNRLWNMRHIELKFIKDVITFLLDFHEKNKEVES